MLFRDIQSCIIKACMSALAAAHWLALTSYGTMYHTPIMALQGRMLAKSERKKKEMTFNFSLNGIIKIPYNPLLIPCVFYRHQEQERSSLFNKVK